MNLREIGEKYELENLSELATKSINSMGRKKEYVKCDIRTEFQRDRDKIIHCKTFRRLMHKTQVFIAPEGDHYRTRLTHTLEVSQISRTIARALRLNEDLTEAIALGHDLGHTPFGHIGEDALNKISPVGFFHNQQSVRIVEVIEKSGQGLNLTYEVLDGICNHRSNGKPNTLEGKIVQLSDKIAYINHDIDDAIRAGILKESDLPVECTEVLGSTSRDRINFLIKNVIKTSYGQNKIELDSDVKHVMNKLRKFMFETVYHNQLLLTEREKIEHMFSELHSHYLKNLQDIPKEFKAMIENGEPKERVICDYISCMTDRFAIKTFVKIFMPSTWDKTI